MRLAVLTGVVNQEGRRERLQSLIALVRKNEFPYQEREPPSVDHASYDLAQVHEMNDVLNLIRELVDLAVERVEAPAKRPPGRPPTPAADVVKVLLAQSYFGVPNRVAEGLLLLFREKLGLHADFSYKTIERGFDRGPVNRLLDEVFVLTNEPVKGLERVFTVDGSGFPTKVRDHYGKDREQQRTKSKGESDAFAGDARSYVYNVAVLGVRFKVLAGWVSRAKGDVGEHGLFPGVMERVGAIHDEIDSILGDGLYATRPCCEVVAQLGARPVFLPRRNATFKSHGVPAWPRMLAELVDHPQEWLEAYHMRSLSETGFSVLKRDNPQPLRKKLDPRKETEGYLRGIVYNIKRLCYLTYLADLHPLPAAS